ncbi:MAG TPA: tetratricopeptide repeat protein [Chloroflexota bacterium]|jgi:tetratricopeptide (TPR) repeat protein|nr:tetratricopeptide repeat protein [Chloroflexota bacterium]
MLDQPPAVGDRVPNKRQLSEQAIALALQGRWEDAVQINRRLLTFYPNEADAYNRLGKALTELGRYAEARDAYGQAVQADPGNAIARRNLERLQLLTERQVSGETAGNKAEKLDPRLFVEEPGKTLVTALQHLAPPELLARVNAGDLVRFRIAGRSLLVENAAGEKIGEVDAKLAQRLIHFIQVGNQYVAAIKSLDGREVRVFIRETVQHPSLAGRATFPTRADSAHRAYTRDTLFRLDADDEDEEYDEAEGDFVERDHHDEDSDDDEPTVAGHELERGFEIDHEEE